MRIEWKMGRPDVSGDYIVVFDNGYVMQLPFTPEHGWNTTDTTWESAFKDEEIIAWAEAFGKHVIDIYGHRDIIKEKEG